MVGREVNCTTEPPTQPGAYWFRRDPLISGHHAQVRETNGELTVWWPNKDQPVARTERARSSTALLICRTRLGRWLPRTILGTVRLPRLTLSP